MKVTMRCMFEKDGENVVLEIERIMSRSFFRRPKVHGYIYRANGTQVAESFWDGQRIHRAFTPGWGFIFGQLDK